MFALVLLLELTNTTILLVMRKIIVLTIFLLANLGILSASVKLQKQGSATQLVVDGKPMLLLAVELRISAATSPLYIAQAL